MIAVSLILALVLASISVIAAFAAPTPKSRTAFGNQVSELNFARAWYNSVRLNAANFVAASDPAKAQQYLSQYAFALRQADTIAAGRGTATTGNQSNNNNQSNNDRTPAQQDLAGWLHMMRGLRDKLTSMGFTANVSNSSSVAGAGVPVTGGSNSNSGTSNNGTSNNGTSNSSTSSSAATPTATPGTGSSSNSGTGSSSAATPTATPGTGSSSSSNSSNSTSSNTNNGAIPNTGANSTLSTTALAKVWGTQFRDLQANRVWLNNFKSHPENLTNASDPVKVQQWISQYEFALSQADAIIRSGGAVTTNNNNNQSTSNSNNSTQFNQSNRSAQQNLATWLHMMRSLQMKLISGTNGANGGM